MITGYDGDKKWIGDIECVHCSKFFWAYEGNVCEVGQICGKCYLEQLPWKKCKTCGCVTATTPCFICDRGWKRDKV